MIDNLIDIALVLLALPTIGGLLILGIAYIVATVPDSDQDQPQEMKDKWNKFDEEQREERRKKEGPSAERKKARA
jgi:hypothetical protein